MQSQEPQSVVAVFDSQEEADAAVRALRSNSFDPNKIDITTTAGVRFESAEDDGKERTLVTVRSDGRMAQAAAILEDAGGFLDPSAAGSWENVNTNPGSGESAQEMGISAASAPPPEPDGSGETMPFTNPDSLDGGLTDDPDYLTRANHQDALDEESGTAERRAPRNGDTPNYTTPA